MKVITAANISAIIQLRFRAVLAHGLYEYLSLVERKALEIAVLSLFGSSFCVIGWQGERQTVDHFAVNQMPPSLFGPQQYGALAMRRIAQ